jgi:DNA-binding MurR/RpiR family transcriptional regulator
MEPISVIYSIKNKYTELSIKEKLIADYILQHPTACIDPSINTLSSKVGTSEATLVRFVRKIGYPGYQQFRIALAKAAIIPKNKFYEIDLDNTDNIASVIFKHTINVLEASSKSLDNKSIKKATTMMIESEKVYLFGLGGSNISARDAFHKFIRTGISCNFAEDFHMQLMLASQTTNKDCAILFSHLGNNYDIISLSEELKKKGCNIIVITSYSNSPLAKLANIVLQTTPIDNSSVDEAFSSSIATATFINILYVEIMNIKENEGVAALNNMRETIARRRT